MHRSDQRGVRRWLRYTLRSSLLIATVLCVVLGYKVNQVSRQRNAVRTLLKERAIVVFDYQFQSSQSPPGPTWLSSLLGPDFFAHVEMVSFLVPMMGGPTSDNINDDLLRQFRALPQLKQVILQDCHQVTDVGLLHLVGLRRVEMLWLARTAVTDRGMDSVANMRLLKRLDLEDTAVTDDGLAKLVVLQDLEELNLLGTSVSDRGIKYLSRLKKLRQLDLTITQVTPAGVETLRRALPNCEIYDP